MEEENETVKMRLQTGLADFTSLTRQLLEAVIREGKISGEQNAQSVTTVIDKLIERNSEIQALADTAIEMRSKQDDIDRVAGELEVKERELMSLQAKLQEAEKILEETVYRGRQKLDSILTAKNGAVSPELLIRYAHRISQASSTVSPVGWQPNDPRRPFPQDIEMRSGHLGRLTSGQEAVVGSKVNDGSTDVSARMQVTGFNHNNNNPTEGRGFQAAGRATRSLR
ncbi:mediator of RNA polymerase II transcription subunit 4-like isoform X1 [Halichondria panicea]|uniref:mediator of RNA polymerase II transcription subunit 4-like isoform X1 n=1 Tax=Halichondria panicea TaxID=6063 RepID=UPI00312B44B6